MVVPFTDYGSAPPPSLEPEAGSASSSAELTSTHDLRASGPSSRASPHARERDDDPERVNLNAPIDELGFAAAADGSLSDFAEGVAEGGEPALSGDWPDEHVAGLGTHYTGSIMSNGTRFVADEAGIELSTAGVLIPQASNDPDGQARDDGRDGPSIVITSRTTNTDTVAGDETSDPAGSRCSSHG